MQIPLAVLVMVSTALAAPPVLILQPLIISRDVQGPGSPQLLLAAAPEGNVVLVAGQNVPSQEGESDNGQYVEKYEDHDEESKNEGTEEFNEKTEEYNEKTEEYNEKTENYDEKYEETSEGTEDYNEKYEERQETTPSQDYIEKDDDTLKYETKDYDNTIEGSGGRPEEGNLEIRAGKSSDERETSKGEDNAKQLRKEIVLGSQNKGEVTSTPAVVKLAPPLQETQEVQLAPVVYHVSPKELTPASKK